MRKYDIVILGAGISGLSLAHHAARQGLSTCVIESADRVGGAFHTHRCNASAESFWIELGAHTCYNSYAGLIEILEQTGQLSQLLERQKVPFRLLVDDEIKSIPSQISFIELLLSVPRMLFLDKTRESVESYYSKIVGKKNFANLFQHMFNAVPSQRSNDFPADVLFKKRERRKDVLRSFTFNRGLASVTEKISAQSTIDIETGNAATEIQQEIDGFRITTQNGESYQSRYLVVATSAAVAARLLRPVDSSLADELAKMKVVTFESTGVVVDKAKLSIEPVAGIVPVDDCFYSVVSRDAVADDQLRGFTFHFKSDQGDKQTRLQRIADVLGVSVNDFRHVSNRSNVLPSLRAGHHDWVTGIDKMLAGKNLLLTGNYFSGVSIEDCVSRSRSELGRLKSSSKP